MENLQIVFAFYKDEELQGFRADTFNTISMTYPKVYTYSKEQIETVLSNIRETCSRSGTDFIKKLERLYEVTTSALRDHLTNSEKKLRAWGEFEVRVYQYDPFMFGEGEEWKSKMPLGNSQNPLEIHKFKIVENEN